MEPERRVIVVEDSPDYRASLSEFLELAPGFALAGSYGSAEAMLEDATRDPAAGSWEIALMDLDLPGMHGLDAIPKLKALHPRVAVVVLTVFEEPRTVLQAITAGADGYLLKRSSARELSDQLRAVMTGGAPLTSGVARTILDLIRDPEPLARAASDDSRPRRLNLTDRELDVLRGLVDGRGYKGTADSLDISPETVRSHIKSIYGKLQVHSVAAAVAVAIRRGLV